MEVSVGALSRIRNSDQVQQYGPAKYYPNFSLLMEGLTGLVPEARTDSISSPTTRDSVQRPYDSIGPNWDRNATRTVPLQGMIAAPFTVGRVKLAAGFGVVEYARLDYYYQNNNLLDPAINVQRPVPVPLVKNDSLPLGVSWSQASHDREGSVRGIGGALSVGITDEVSFGVSGMVLRGTATDREEETGRGHFTFYTNYFRLDSVSWKNVRSGTSEFSGQEIVFSASYHGRVLSAGVAVKPPTSLTRNFSSTTWCDTGGVVTQTTEGGEDRLELPWRGSLGGSITVRPDLIIALEIEWRPYASVVRQSASGSEDNPWLSASVLRGGILYMPLEWLTLRAGAREYAEVFGPEGNPIPGDPVRSSALSAGIGVRMGGIRFDMAYEYAKVKYNDLYQNNVNLNSEARHDIMFSVTYALPWL
jgi:hypothetical protein